MSLNNAFPFYKKYLLPFRVDREESKGERNNPCLLSQAGEIKEFCARWKQGCDFQNVRLGRQITFEIGLREGGDNRWQIGGFTWGAWFNSLAFEPVSFLALPIISHLLHFIPTLYFIVIFSVWIWKISSDFCSGRLFSPSVLE